MSVGLPVLWISWVDEYVIFCTNIQTRKMRSIFLTSDQNQGPGLDLFCRDPQDFLHRFVNVNDTWIHYYTPKIEQQTKKSITSGELVPHKVKIVLSAGEILVTVFWVCQRIILFNYEWIWKSFQKISTSTARMPSIFSHPTPIRFNMHHIIHHQLSRISKKQSTIWEHIKSNFKRQVEDWIQILSSNTLRRT